MGWFNSNWKYRAQMDVNFAMVEDTLKDFPVFLDMGNFGPNHLFWSAVQDDGDDIRITKADGITDVNRKINSLDVDNKTGDIDFLAEGDPGLRPDTRNTFFIYFGNPDASAPSDTDVTGGGDTTSDAWKNTTDNNENKPLDFINAYSADTDIDTGGECGRGLSSAVKDHIGQEVLRPVGFFEFNYDEDGTERYWTGYGKRFFDGKMFTGTGDLIQLGTVQETDEIEAVNVTFRMSGVPQKHVDYSLDKNYQNRHCKVWLGWLDENNRLIDTPDVTYIGIQDVINITDSDEEVGAELNTENRLIKLNGQNGRRYTFEDQRLDFPQDKGFEFVAQMQDKTLHFGPAASKPEVNITVEQETSLF
jgi:hypothetical protein